MSVVDDNKTIDENGDISIPLTWNEKVDDLLIEWCDIARCYKWLHMRAYESYSTFNMIFTIPSIVLSTVSGTASFAQESMPPTYRTYAPMAIGTINIFVGIIATLQRYFKIAELNESYKVAYISWDKFSRNIQIEISKDPKQRTSAKSFFKTTRMEYDRLLETSPPIPPFIIRKFTVMIDNENKDGTVTTMLKQMGIIKDHKTEEEKEEEEDMFVRHLHKPDIFNNIESSYYSSWYKREKKISKFNGNSNASDYNDPDKRKRLSYIFNQTSNNMKNHRMKKIDDFIYKFKSANEREPLKYEIEDHFKDTECEKLLEEYFKSHGYKSGGSGGSNENTFMENAIDNV